MARRSRTHKRPVVEAGPQMGVQQDTSAPKGGEFTALLEKATQEILVLTYWFDPVPNPEPYPVTIRFSGRRTDTKKRLAARDRFVHDETIKQVVPGSGPISLTAHVRDINPGAWIVTADMLGSASRPAQRLRGQGNVPSVAGPLRPALRFWQRWAPSTGSNVAVKTCLPLFAHVPGIFPGIWGAMVALGIAVALLLQSLVISRAHLAAGRWWIVSLVAIVIGIIGAKVWYLVLYRRERLINGWCIQGFITCAILAAAILLVVLAVPAGVFLDMTTPGLLVAMAVGRVGCFFAGCCGGPPTASRWGVWSSDQQVGARRIPTQLLEMVLALSLGIGALVAIVSHGPAGGAFFAAALATYTLVRQGILRLRAESRKTRRGGLVTASLSALVLIAALVFLFW